MPIIGIAALSSVFANTGYLGIPLFLTAFGPDQAGPAIVATVTVNIVFVGGTICFLELAGNNKATPAVTMINVFRALAKNPLISAPVLALPFTIFGIQLPILAPPPHLLPFSLLECPSLKELLNRGREK